MRVLIPCLCPAFKSAFDFGTGDRLTATSSRTSWLVPNGGRHFVQKELVNSHILGIGILVGASSYFILDESAVSSCLQQVSFSTNWLLPANFSHFVQGELAAPDWLQMLCPLLVSCSLLAAATPSQDELTVPVWLQLLRGLRPRRVGHSHSQDIENGNHFVHSECWLHRAGYSRIGASWLLQLAAAASS